MQRGKHFCARILDYNFTSSHFTFQILHFKFYISKNLRCFWNFCEFIEIFFKIFAEFLKIFCFFWKSFDIFIKKIYNYKNGGKYGWFKTRKKVFDLGLAFLHCSNHNCAFYHFHVIKLLELFLCSTYVIYFVGLALLFTGGYNEEKHNSFAKWIMWILGFLFLIVSTALLVFGIKTGQISLFN